MKVRTVENALLFIEERLKSKISLEDIADAANLSPWYFHRLFRVLTGHCVVDYLRRRRICEASHELLYSSESIRKIASDYQFESQEAFTRSFSSICGISPGRFRKMMAPITQFPAISLDTSYRYIVKGDQMQKPKIETKASFTVVGVQCTATPNETLHKLWGEFMERCAEIKHVAELDKAYQVCVYDQSNPSNDTFTFIAGMAVSDTAEIPQGMVAHTVNEATYAVFEHHGLLDKLHQSYEYIFGIWLQENGYKMAEADSLEIYDERFKHQQEDSILEILVPITKA